MKFQTKAMQVDLWKVKAVRERLNCNLCNFLSLSFDVRRPFWRICYSFVFMPLEISSRAPHFAGSLSDWSFDIDILPQNSWQEKYREQEQNNGNTMTRMFVSLLWGLCPMSYQVTPTAGGIALKIRNFGQNIAFRSQTRIFFPNVSPEISWAISKLLWITSWTCFIAI